MTSLSARRKRRFRERQKAGAVVLRIEICEHQLAEALIVSGRLSDAEAMHRAELERAAAAILEQWAHSWGTRPS